jgi:broad specificity phosphatase PhoE
MPGLILVRHARPQIIEDRPARTWRLSREGAEETRRLAERLANVSPAAIVASPEPKARATADLLAKVFGLEVEIDPALVEQRRETAPWLSQRDFDAAMARLFDEPSAPSFGEESADQAYERFALGIERRVASLLGPTMIVTHGTVIALWVSRRLGIEPLPFWKRLTMPCAVLIGAGSDWELIA